MRKWIVFLFAWTSVCFSQQTQLNSDLEVAGTVRGDDGTVITAAAVSLHRLNPHQGRPRQSEWAAATDAVGGFRFSIPHPGQYRLCVHVPGSAWVNPCDWGLAPQSAWISSAAKADNVSLVMKKGAALRVRVDDPGQLLAQHEGKTPGAHLLLGVAGPNASFHQAQVISTDSKGRTYQIVIPYTASLKLIVSSAFFQLNDTAGLAVARTGTAAIPLVAVVGQPAPTLNLVVTGKAR